MRKLNFIDTDISIMKMGNIDNPFFNYSEFSIINNSAGLNSYKISVEEFETKEKRNDKY